MIVLSSIYPFTVFVSEYRETTLILNIRAWVPASSYAGELANIMLEARKVLEGEGFELPIAKVGHIKIDLEKAVEADPQETKQLPQV